MRGTIAVPAEGASSGVFRAPPGLPAGMRVQVIDLNGADSVTARLFSSEDGRRWSVEDSSAPLVTDDVYRASLAHPPPMLRAVFSVDADPAWEDFVLCTLVFGPEVDEDEEAAAHEERVAFARAFLAARGIEPPLPPRGPGALLSGAEPESP